MATSGAGLDPLAAAAARLRGAGRWHRSETLFWLLVPAGYFGFSSDLVLLAQIAITALFALSLDLILGFAGIVSLGHAAFFGIGAYGAGLLAQRGWGDPLLGLGVASLAAAGAGFLSSFLVLRGTDLTRLMVTLGISLMLFEAANKMTGLTGGVDGMQGIEIKPLLGVFRFDLAGRTGFLYSAAVLFVLFWIARRIRYAPFGRGLNGIRQNPVRMPALGMPVNARLVAIYTVAAGYAGAAGALLAQTTQFVSIDVLGFTRSAELMLIVVLGGTGTLYGALIGAIVFMIARQGLSQLNPEYWEFWLGALLLAVVLFGRGGIVGIAQRVVERIAARGTGGAQ